MLSERFVFFISILFDEPIGFMAVVVRISVPCAHLQPLAYRLVPLLVRCVYAHRYERGTVEPPQCFNFFVMFQRIEDERDTLRRSIRWLPKLLRPRYAASH